MSSPSNIYAHGSQDIVTLVEGTFYWDLYLTETVCKSRITDYCAVAGLNYGPRKELVNNIDQIANAYAMIYEDQYGGLYKLLGGNVFDNSFIGWSVSFD